MSSARLPATAHSIHLYSVHRAVIFAIAQLSCLIIAFDYKFCANIITGFVI